MRSLLHYFTVSICIAGTLGLPQFNGDFARGADFSKYQQQQQQKQQQAQQQVAKKGTSPQSPSTDVNNWNYLIWGGLGLSAVAAAIAKIRSKMRPNDPIKDAVNTLKKAYSSPEQLARATQLRDCFEDKMKHKSPGPHQSWYDFRVQMVNDCITEMKLSDDQVYDVYRAFLALDRIMETYEQLEGRAPDEAVQPQPQSSAEGQRPQQTPPQTPPPPTPDNNPSNGGLDRLDSGGSGGPIGGRGGATLESRLDPDRNPMRGFISSVSNFGLNAAAAINKVRASSDHSAGLKPGLPFAGLQAHWTPMLSPIR